MRYRPNKVHHDEGMIKAASFDNDPDSIEIVMPCTNTLNSNNIICERLVFDVLILC